MSEKDQVEATRSSNKECGQGAATRSRQEQGAVTRSSKIREQNKER